MSSDNTDFEKRLVADPFNNELRSSYSNYLIENNSWDEALQQIKLLLSQGYENAEILISKALCLHRLGQISEGLQVYEVARKFVDFKPNPELDKLVAKTKPATTSLRVIDGEGRGADVIELKPQSQSGDKVGFDNIAGMVDLKKTLSMQIIEPFLRPKLFARFKKKAGGGILLYGPPGCGKTMIARAIATECNAYYLAVGISDILNMWIGESERNLVEIFEKARAHKPAVLFFDELDALAFSRSKARSEHTRSTVNEFLSQLDSINNRNEQVLVIAATNMPWDVDPAMKRPGRFSRQIFVPPPDLAARTEMLKIKLEGIPCDPLDFVSLAKLLPKCSGADIDGIIEYAKETVLMEIVESGNERNLNQKDLIKACKQQQPSTIEWLKTARNLVKYAGADDTYKDVEKYFKENKL